MMMSPDNLRTLADSMAWHDRQDLKDAMLAAADRIERLIALREALFDAVVRDTGMSGDRRFVFRLPNGWTSSRATRSEAIAAYLAAYDIPGPAEAT